MNKHILIRNGALRCTVNIQDPSDPVQQFARRELNKYLKRAAAAKESQGALTQINLQAGTASTNGFNIRTGPNGITIFGANASSLLIAVYAFLKRACGYRWYAFDHEWAPTHRALSFQLEKPWEEQATFSRRGLFPEGRKFSLKYLQQLIDWGPKNTLSDITFSMSAWPQWKEKLEPQLRKRGTALTLSGHCLPTFVPKSMFETHPDWFALIDGKRVPQGQYCFSSKPFQSYLTEQLLHFITQEPLLTRISIWAQDTYRICECPACKKQGFLKSFTSTINQIAAACKKKAPGVNIEFLAYNAALSWDMLEPDKRIFPLQCSTELAYWGRDYRYDFARSPTATDIRARQCFQAWRKLSDKTLHVLEYYTSLWMNTHLITARPTIIQRDMKDYAQLGIDDMSLLISLCAYNLTDTAFSWSDANQKTAANLYFFAMNSWIPDPDLLKDYCANRYGAHSAFCEQVLRLLEKVLGEVTSFNIKLFRLRFVDPWCRDATPNHGGIRFVPQIWEPGLPWRAVDEERRLAGQRMLKALRRFSQKTPWPTRNISPDARQLREHWEYILANLQCLQHQFEAQKGMSDQQWALAVDHFAQALLFKSVLTKTDRAQCLKWRTYCTRKIQAKA